MQQRKEMRYVCVAMIAIKENSGVTTSRRKSTDDIFWEIVRDIFPKGRKAESDVAETFADAG